MSTPQPLTAAQRDVLASLADVLVAEGHGMPAASQVGVAGDLLDRCLDAAPALAEPLLALLGEAPPAEWPTLSCAGSPPSARTISPCCRRRWWAPTTSALGCAS